MPPAADNRAIERIAARYPGRFHAGYARGKLRHDPVFAAIADWLEGDDQPLLDIGCGLGLLGQYLRERGWRGAYHGIDLDAPKIAAAQAAAAALGGFDCVTGTVPPLPPGAGHVALVDVLHYLPHESQQALLREAAQRLAPGGLLMIRNVLRAPGWRFRITRAEEWLIRSLGWMRAAVRHYPTRAELEQPLRAAGLEVEVAPLWRGTPFNSYAIVARRPGSRQAGDVAAALPARGSDTRSVADR